MTDPNELLAAQIGRLVIANAQQAARIAQLEAALAAATARPAITTPTDMGGD